MRFLVQVSLHLDSLRLPYVLVRVSLHLDVLRRLHALVRMSFHLGTVPLALSIESSIPCDRVSHIVLVGTLLSTCSLVRISFHLGSLPFARVSLSVWYNLQRRIHVFLWCR